MGRDQTLTFLFTNSIQHSEKESKINYFICAYQILLLEFNFTDNVVCCTSFQQNEKKINAYFEEVKSQ